METNTSEYDLNNLILKLKALEDDLVNVIGNSVGLWNALLHIIFLKVLILYLITISISFML